MQLIEEKCRSDSNKAYFYKRRKRTHIKSINFLLNEQNRCWVCVVLLVPYILASLGLRKNLPFTLIFGNV